MVTHEWLIGTGIAIIAIISSLIIYQNGKIQNKFDEKMDKDRCQERHDVIDRALEKLDRINDVVVRIETILNGKK